MKKIISMLLLVMFIASCSKKLTWFRTYVEEVERYEFIDIRSGDIIIMKNANLDTVDYQWWIDYDLKAIIFKDRYDRLTVDVEQ